MKIVFFLLITFFIFSCGNLSLETDSVVVDSIKSGQILSAGDSFEISIDTINNDVTVNPSNAEVSIIYSNSQARGGLSVEPVNFSIDLDESPDSNFQISSDFQDGLYTLLITVYEGNSVLTEYEAEFIVYSDYLRGEILNLYPSKDLYINSVILLEGNIIHDPNLDPYLIWRQDQDIISEGYLSQGANEILWNTTDKYGFIEIQLEIFPYKFSNSNIKSKRVVDFSFIVNPLYNDLYNSEVLASFYKAFYFNGNYYNEVDKKNNIEIYGPMVPKVINDFYGMVMGPSQGFISNESIFPVNESTGQVESFSLLLNMLPLTYDNGSIINSTNGKLNLNLYAENEELYLAFNTLNTEQIILTLGDINIEEPTSYILSFVKQDNGYNVFYYLNGILLGDSFWYISNADSMQENSSENRLAVGGSDIKGFSCILNSLEVYYRDFNNNSNIYDAVLEIHNNYYDNEYYLQEGFNSQYLPDNLIGLGSIDGEVLRIENGSFLTYENIIPNINAYNLVITATLDSLYLLTLYNDNGESIEHTLNGISIIKNKGNDLFINEQKILGVGSIFTSFEIKALNTIFLDSITVESRDVIVD